LDKVGNLEGNKFLMSDSCKEFLRRRRSCQSALPERKEEKLRRWAGLSRKIL